MAQNAENESEQTQQSGAADGVEQAAAPAAEQAAAQAAEQGTPKQSRRRSRARSVEQQPGQRLSPEERHARRAQHRRAKAVGRRVRRAQEREKEKAARARAGGGARAQELPAVHAVVRGAPKERQGVVVSSRADKTITVRIDVARQHRRYEKIVRSSSTLHAHDEQNSAHEGDVVRVVESRPMSKTKRWQLVEVMERAR